jgi:hypothetical protein
MLLPPTASLASPAERKTSRARLNFRELLSSITVAIVTVVLSRA